MPADPPTPGPWTEHPTEGLDVVLDGPALRALAHPVRVRLLGLLRSGGPSTASRLAGQLGLNSGATSYHLRQLAAAGLVVEDADRGNRRDRWWRAVHRSSYFAETSYDSDPEAAAAYLGAVASAYAERLVGFPERMVGLPAEWGPSATMSDYRLRLTAEEGADLLHEVLAVVARYRRDDDVVAGLVDPPPGAREVVVQLQVMPSGGPTGAGPDPSGAEGGRA